MANARKILKEHVVDVLAMHLGEPDPLPENSFAVAVGDNGRICCGCGWISSVAMDVDEWRAHLADAILVALDGTTGHRTNGRTTTDAMSFRDAWAYRKE